MTMSDQPLKPRPPLDDAARELARETYAQLPTLSADTHVILVLGLGSGAVLERILAEHGPEPPDSRLDVYARIYGREQAKPRMRLPVWVLEPNPGVSEQVLAAMDAERALELRQLRIFSGPDALAQLERAIVDPWTPMLSDWVLSPDASWSQESLQEVLRRVQAARERRLALVTQRAADWRRRHRHEHDSRSAPVAISLRERFMSGKKLRILVLGTRFGVFTGHSSAYLRRAFELLGHDARLLEEKSDVERVTSDIVQQTVNEFMPDVIASINYSRGKYLARDNALDGIPFCCWIQDPWIIDELRRSDTRAKHGELDFYFSACDETIQQLGDLGYGDVPQLKAPTNPESFCPGEPTNTEQEYFGCEVSFVSTISSSAVQAIFSDDEPSPDDRPRCISYRDVYRQMTERLTRGQPALLPEDYRKILVQYVLPAGQSSSELSPEVEARLRLMTLMLEAEPGRVALRGFPVMWLLDAGHDVAFFGPGWEGHPILGQHTRGGIPYGEPLLGLLRASPIHLCIHGIWTLTMKVLDCFAAGTFPLVGWVESSRDTGPITEWYQEDRDVVLFRCREELLDKVAYYLRNPGERQAITNRGREITLRNFTYKNTAEAMLASIRSRFGAV